MKNSNARKGNSYQKPKLAWVQAVTPGVALLDRYLDGDTSVKEEMQTVFQSYMGKDDLRGVIIGKVIGFAIVTAGHPPQLFAEVLATGYGTWMVQVATQYLAASNELGAPPKGFSKTEARKILERIDERATPGAGATGGSILALLQSVTDAHARYPDLSRWSKERDRNEKESDVREALTELKVDKTNELQSKRAVLEALKAKAVADEDFAKAGEHKAEIDKIDAELKTLQSEESEAAPVALELHLQEAAPAVTPVTPPAPAVTVQVTATPASAVSTQAPSLDLDSLRAFKQKVRAANLGEAIVEQLFAKAIVDLQAAEQAFQVIID